MNLDRAKSLTSRAVQEAARFQLPICVSVCDDRGLLVAFLRMDGAPARSVDLSQSKAYSAARLGSTTAAFHARLQRDAMPASYFCDPRLTGLPGGSVIKSTDGAILGGVGISGLTPAQDQEIADLLAANG